MPTEKIENFYIIEPHPRDRGCSIFEYRDEKFEEIYKDFEVKSNIKYSEIMKEIKKHLKGLRGDYVVFPEIKNTNEFWSFQNMFDKNYFSGHVCDDFKVYEINDDYKISEKPMNGEDGIVKVRKYNSLSKKDSKHIIKFFRKNIFSDDEKHLVRFLRKLF